MTTQTVSLREDVSKDELGRVICTQYKDFWAYVEKKRMTKADLLKMKSDRREDFFITWKHGMTDNNVNWEFEYSLRQFLRNFKDVPMDQIDPYFRDSVITRREFEEYCDKIKIEIGLWAGKRVVPQEVKELVDQVAGTLVDHGEEK